MYMGNGHTENVNVDKSAATRNSHRNIYRGNKGPTRTFPGNVERTCTCVYVITNEFDFWNLRFGHSFE